MLTFETSSVGGAGAITEKLAVSEPLNPRAIRARQATTFEY